MLRIRTLFFALYRDMAGTDALELELPEGATALAAVRALRERGAGFARLPERPVIAINQEYAPIETRVHDGDELALLPPVAGG